MPDQLPARQIAFGWDRQTDEQSLRAFAERFCRAELLDVLIPRLDDQEITGLVDHLSRLMRSHLSEKEYHRLFMGVGE